MVRLADIGPNAAHLETSATAGPDSGSCLGKNFFRLFREINQDPRPIHIAIRLAAGTVGIDESTESSHSG